MDLPVCRIVIIGFKTNPVCYIVFMRFKTNSVCYIVFMRFKTNPVCYIVFMRFKTNSVCRIVSINKTNIHGYVRFIVFINQSFSHAWLITGFVTSLIRRVPLTK
jgi:hypothetical protein